MKTALTLNNLISHADNVGLTFFIIMFVGAILTSVTALVMGWAKGNYGADKLTAIIGLSLSLVMAMLGSYCYLYIASTMNTCNAMDFPIAASIVTMVTLTVVTSIVAIVSAKR